VIERQPSNAGEECFHDRGSCRIQRSAFVSGAADMFKYLTEEKSESADARQLRSAKTSTSVEARSTRLLALMTALTERETVEDVCNVVLGAGLEVVKAASGFIAVVDGPQLRVVATCGYDPGTRARLRGLSMNDDVPVTRSIRLARPVYLRSVDERHQLYPDPYAQYGDVDANRAHAALPLVHDGVAIGALGLSFAAPRAFGAADRIFTLLLAQAAAAALHRASHVDDARSHLTAERRRQAREEVLSMVAHDLRNPLNLIYGTTQLLSECQLSCEERERLLGVCTRSVTRMNRLIGDLLDVTRLQSGRLPLTLEVVDARNIIASLDETFRPQADKQRVRLTVNAPATEVRATLDPARIEQALGNLIANALKFTPEGGAVSLELRQTVRGILFLVHDTGPGIPADNIEHIFERFWQARSDNRGIGLGLAIVKGIADAHGGDLSVTSRPGVGSTFQLELPERA
jgi:signal transduction histidine kinase